MERNILYSYNIDQRSVYENGWDLSNDHLAIFAFITHFTSSRHSIKIVDGSETWTWISHKLILEQMPLIKIKERRLQDYIKDLQSCKLIELNPKNQSLGRTYIRLGENYDAYKGGIVKMKRSDNQNQAKTDISTQNIADKENTYNIDHNNIQDSNIDSAIIADSTQNIADPLGNLLLTPYAKNCVPPTQKIADIKEIQFTTNTIEKVNNLKTDDSDEVLSFEKVLVSDENFTMSIQKIYGLDEKEISSKLDYFVQRKKLENKTWENQTDFNLNFFDWLKFKVEVPTKKPKPAKEKVAPKSDAPERKQLEENYKKKIFAFGEQLKTKASEIETSRIKFNKELNYPFEFNSQALYNHINYYMSYVSDNVHKLADDWLDLTDVDFEKGFYKWFAKQRHGSDLFTETKNRYYKSPLLQQ